MKSIDRSKRISFEEVADLYTEVRPAYPAAVVADIIEFSSIPPLGRILEVGCGPGNATLPFAEHGYTVTAIELGARLAEIAKQRCTSYPRVHILHCAFEDWEVDRGAYDLAISADAFHWIPPEIGYPRLALALKNGGSAALFWNTTIFPDTEWAQKVDELYRSGVYGVENPDRGLLVNQLVDVIRENFAGCRCFDEPQIRQYRWQNELTTDQYLKLLRTYSGHHGMDVGLRDQLYSRIRAVLDQHGGKVFLPQLTILFMAKVK